VHVYDRHEKSFYWSKRQLDKFKYLNERIWKKFFFIFYFEETRHAYTIVLARYPQRRQPDDRVLPELGQKLSRRFQRHSAEKDRRWLESSDEQRT
jgi:hypothetical protein